MAYDVMPHIHIDAPSREAAEAYVRTLLAGKEGVRLLGVVSADCYHVPAVPTLSELDEIRACFGGGQG